MLLAIPEIIAKLHINKQQQKTFIFDLDGTIIYDGLPLEARFERVLREIEAAGHQIIFATGRSWRDFLPVLPKWCHQRPSVLFGGGLVIRDDTIRFQHFLAENDLTDLVEHLETKRIKYLVDGHAAYYHPPVEHWIYDDIVKISGMAKDLHVDNIIRDGAYKILVLEDNWLGEFNQLIAARELVIKHHVYDKCFDVMPQAVNKFSGLQHMELPAAENIFVFGNDGNDLELMQNLPNSVMFGTHPELSKYAKIKINYDDDLFNNFVTVINTILEKC